MAAGSLFERTVAAQRLGPGRFAAAVDPAWNGPISPNGGVLAAAMVRAAQAELGPEAPPPRIVTAQFLDAPSAGAVELAVEVLRRGRRVAVCDVRLHQGGRLMVQATIVHSAAREDPLTLRRAAPPAAPPDPAAHLPAETLRGFPPIFSALEVQPVFGGLPLSGAAAAQTGGWVRFRGDEGPVDPARLVALSDTWWPALFAVTDHFVGVPTLGLTVHLRELAPPPPWPVLARFRSRHVAEGHIEEQGEIFSASGRLLAESVQLSLVLG